MRPAPLRMRLGGFSLSGISPHLSGCFCPARPNALLNAECLPGAMMLWSATACRLPCPHRTLAVPPPFAAGGFFTGVLWQRRVAGLLLIQVANDFLPLFTIGFRADLALQALQVQLPEPLIGLLELDAVIHRTSHEFSPRLRKCCHQHRPPAPRSACSRLHRAG